MGGIGRSTTHPNVKLMVTNVSHGIAQSPLSVSTRRAPLILAKRLDTYYENNKWTHMLMNVTHISVRPIDSACPSDGRQLIFQTIRMDVHVEKGKRCIVRDRRIRRGRFDRCAIDRERRKRCDPL